jgi:response regulator NasT
MLRVLIVDDEAVLTFVLRQQLELRGCEVVGTAPNGKAAVETCRAVGPDVVLMDIRMPVMDGLEATRLIMEQSPTCVIMMTAYGAADTAAQAEAAGAMGYLTKPLGVEQVLQAVAPARARFGEFEAIRAEAADLGEALATLRLVEAAKRVLAGREEEAEGDFTALRELALRRGVSLRAAAEGLLAGSDSPS